MSKYKAHTRYKNKVGDYVPGTTTVTGILNKPALVRWANNLGLHGVDVSKYVDDMASIGTLAHYMVECYCKKVKPELGDYTPNQIDLAENAVLKFYSWEKENKFEVIEVEMKLISEQHQFGGQCDIYCMLNGKKTLIDLKTSKACYPEHYTQVSAYKQLLAENGHEVDDVRILRIGRDESEGFEDKKVPLLDIHWKRFLHCLEIYKLNKQLRGK